MDLIISKNQNKAILVFVERLYNYCIIIRLEYGKNAAELAKAAIKKLSEYKDFIHTITVDNGTEFACHEEISKALNADILIGSTGFRVKIIILWICKPIKN